MRIKFFPVAPYLPVDNFIFDANKVVIKCKQIVFSLHQLLSNFVIYWKVCDVILFFFIFFPQLIQKKRKNSGLGERVSFSQYFCLDWTYFSSLLSKCL